MEDSNPRGMTHSPIIGTTVRLAGRATIEKRWKWWAIKGIVIIVAAVVTAIRPRIYLRIECSVWPLLKNFLPFLHFAIREKIKGASHRMPATATKDS